MTDRTDTARPSLVRALGRWDLTAIGVNQVIGSGIFLLPALVAANVGAWSPWAVLGVGGLSLVDLYARANLGEAPDPRTTRARHLARALLASDPAWAEEMLGGEVRAADLGLASGGGVS